MDPLDAILPYGVVIGNRNTPRIFCLSTSSQVQDHAGFEQALGYPITSTDKGYQLHLYTRENDLLLVRVPPPNISIESFHLVYSAIGINQQLWAYFTGVKLCGPTKNQIAMVSEISDLSCVNVQRNVLEQFNFHPGTLDQVSRGFFKQNGCQIVLPIISQDRIRGIIHDPRFDSIAAWVSTLNDKNRTIPILQKCGIMVPRTFIVTKISEIDGVLAQLDPSEKYVFKMAGSVAGIGMFTNHDRGCTPEEIRGHISRLKNDGKIPEHFQIQEFINGRSFGGIVLIDRNRNIQLLSVHQQIIHEGSFLGLQWDPQTEAQLQHFVLETTEKLLAQKEIMLLGTINIDFMIADDGTKYVTEINPRYSAGVPFHTIRSLEANIQAKFPAFTIKTIYLGSNIRFPISILEGDKLTRIVQDLFKESNILVLPQGINPFGNSFVLFINDGNGTGRNKFIEKITGGALKELPLLTGIVEKVNKVK